MAGFIEREADYLLVAAASVWSGAGVFTFSTACFAAFGATDFAGVAVGTLVAAGVGAETSCAGGDAEADEASLYSQAPPIVGATPNMANAVNINTRFMVTSS